MTTVPKPRHRPGLRERLLGKAVINRETGCWEWVGAKSVNGYGQFGIGGFRRIAHRVSYELLEGPIGDGLVLDHLCRVRHCINPAHLEPVTQRENLLRSPIALPTVLAAKTHCPAGHEYASENLRARQGKGRECRSCKREHDRAYKARKRAERQEASA